MHVVVKQKHIDDGIPKDCSRCPISIAIREQLFGSGQIIEVNKYSVYIYINDFQVLNRFTLPHEAKRFIANFDAPCPRIIPEPFEFDMQEEQQ